MTNEKSSIWLAVIVAALFTAALAPTLGWLQFSNSMENLNVATALELRRDHSGDGKSWLIPTLEGLPRVVKPPLTAWITAIAIRSSTLSHLDDRDESSRAAAYQSLAWDVRWPATLIGAMTLLATFALGRAVSDSRTGLIAAAVCASNIFFLRFSRFATTDVMLTLWVTLANALLAKILLDRATFVRCIGAGIALGLAFLSKGPVALVLSIVPATIFAVLNRRAIDWRALLVGMLVFLFVGLWWFVLAANRDHSVLHTWLTETNPAGGDRMSRSNVFLYAVIFAFMMPWTIFLIVGMVRAFQQRDNRAYPTFALLIAILIMSCFHDRKERYILPLVPIAALVTAQGLRFVIDGQSSARGRSLIQIQWIIVAVFAIALCPTLTDRLSKDHPLSPRFGWPMWLISLAMFAIGAIALRKSRWASVPTTLAVMLVVQATALRTYAHLPSGRSDMLPLAQEIRQKFPDAQMFNWRPDGLQKRASVDLSIYMNRITKWIANPQTLPRSDRPQIYITIQQQGSAEPAPAEGWKFLAKVPRDKDWYIAFVRANP